MRLLYIFLSNALGWLGVIDIIFAVIYASIHGIGDAEVKVVVNALVTNDGQWMSIHGLVHHLADPK
jgi:hypothetical protein